MNPKVSICMPNYNYANFLPDAIESALRQSYTNFEFIIFDNHSTDRSAEIISGYAKKDRRIIFNVNKDNIGFVNNLNLCLQYAKGDYIKFLLSDDLFASERTLEIMVGVLDTHQEISLVATARNMIDEKSNIIKVLSEYHGKVGYAGTMIIQDCLIEQKNKIGEPSVVMFRKKHAARGFNTRYRQSVDLEMWFHILEQGNFAYIDEPLCSFRDHPNQQTKVNIARVTLVDEAFQLLTDYANKHYVKLSRIKKEYMHYIPAYAVWKLFKKGRITREAALEKIKNHYNIFKFFTLYPFFKLYKFIRSIARPHKSRMAKGCN